MLVDNMGICVVKWGFHQLKEATTVVASWMLLV